MILQISENCIRYHGRVDPVVLASLALAGAASVKVLVHLDHIEDRDLVDEGVRLGVDSIMYDASRLDYDANVAATRAVASACHDAGIAIEAELGEIGGKDGVHAPGARTDPDEAAKFTATGIDALAVAVGTSHAMTTRDADLDLIGRIVGGCPRAPRPARVVWGRRPRTSRGRGRRHENRKVSRAPPHQHLPAAVDHEEVQEAQHLEAIRLLAEATANRRRYFAHWARVKRVTG